MRAALLPFAGLLLLGVSPAFAEFVEFQQIDATSPEAGIIESFLPGQDMDQVDAAVVDMNRDRRGEVLARLKDQCVGDEGAQCRTVIFRHGVRGWSQAFDDYTGKLEIGETGIGAMRTLYDAQRRWEWNGTSFDFKAGSLGSSIAFSLAPAEYVDPLIEQFGEGARQLFDRNQAVQILVAAADLNNSGAAGQIIVKLDGPGVCGAVFGCPWRILEIQDGHYVSLAQGNGSGEFVVLPVQRGGWSDVASEMPKGGMATYAWDGARYSVSESVQGAKR